MTCVRAKIIGVICRSGIWSLSLLYRVIKSCMDSFLSFAKLHEGYCDLLVTFTTCKEGRELVI